MARAEMGQRRSFLMLVKTYPTPSTKYGETVCCAGIDADTGKWVRVFPVNFRLLDEENRFKKWQMIEAEWTKASDGRPESVKVFQDTIRPGLHLKAGVKGWPVRRQWIDSRVDPSLEWLQVEQARSERSLGLIRPRSVDGFSIRASAPWDEQSKADLDQLSLDWAEPPAKSTSLEIIPFDFRYQFHCDDDACRGHDMEVFDWEVAQSYRSWRRQYSDDGWREAMDAKYRVELPSRDLHFVVGTHHRWKNWMIVGLIYPPHLEVLEDQQATTGEDIRQGKPMTLPGFGLEAEQDDGPTRG